VHAVESTIQPSVLGEKLCLFVAATCYIITKLWARQSSVQIPAMVRDLLLLQNIQTGSAPPPHQTAV